MAQEYTQVNFRIPVKLKEQIEEASLANNRSITAELVSRLEESFNENQQQDSTIADLTDQIKHLKMSFDVLVKALSDKKAP